IAAAFAYGAAALRFLLRAKPRHDVAGLAKTLALAEPVLSGLGFGSGRLAAIETDDPPTLRVLRGAVIAPAPTPCAASFLPPGGGQAGGAAARAPRIAARGAPPRRGHRAARRRAVWPGRSRRERLYAVPCLRVGLSDRRAQRRSGPADAALCRGCLRAMRAVQ